MSSGHVRRAIARGPVGEVPYLFTSGSNGIIDPTAWAVAEYGTMTASGYTVIMRTFQRQSDAIEYRKQLTNNARHSLRQYIILRRKDDGTWEQWLSAYEKQKRKRRWP